MLKTILWNGCAVLATVLASAGARGGDIRVEQQTLPVPFLLPSASAGDPDKVDTQIEASAIETIGDGKFLLVAHDKTTELFVVETATGREVERSLTCKAFPNGAKIAPKWEGLARDDQGFFYVIGTHSGKTDEDRPSRSYLFRFRLTGGAQGTSVAIEEDSVRRWHVEDALKDALGREVSDKDEVNKRKIEGLSIRKVAASGSRPARVELVVGLRDPGDLVRAFAADITETPKADAKLSFRTLFSFDAGTREGVQSQLTSLHYLPEWGGFLVTTATEDKDNVFHGNTLWYLTDEQVARGPRVKPEAVLVFEPAMKVEGLCTLPDANGLNPRLVRLALSFDNDPHSTHIPSRLQTLTLSRGGR